MAAVGVQFGEVWAVAASHVLAAYASAKSVCSRGLLGGLRAMSELPPLRGDEAELIRSYTPALERRLAWMVNTSAANREDAIAFAWTVFLRRQPDRAGPWRAYLATIARNEAIALDRRDRDHDTLTRGSESDHPVPIAADRAPPERPIADPHDGYTQRLELSDAVALLAQLPERPRQVAFLRAHGLPWPEIQELTGLTRTQLNRQLVRANRALEQLLDDRRQAERPLPPRVARLRALEEDPPGWLTSELGRPPTGRHARAEALREWRRAALAIDHYRTRFGITDPASALGERPADPAAGRAHADASRQIDRTRRSRHGQLGLER
jgi:RNA polymerase sigma factor (sigma-70 family)